MTAPIEISDELYRRVKARAAVLGPSVEEVTTELCQRWLGEKSTSESGNTVSWIDDWVSLGAQHARGRPDESSVRQHLVGDRNRLEADRWR